MATTAWTVERVDALRRLWSDGLSCSEIARYLGDTTRNAVIGKVHRMGLGYRAASRRMPTLKPRKPRKPRNYTVKTFAEKKVVLPVEPLPLPADGDIARVSFADLEPHHCRFIPGDPANFSATAPLYCGCDAVPGLSYCAHHAQRVFQPPEPSRKARALPRVTMLHASMDSTRALDEFEKA